MLAGSLASAMSSAFTTPFDVIKTRIATGVIPQSEPILKIMFNIAKQEGMSGMYAGAQSRIIWSALFGGIGFTTFEYCKNLLTVDIDSTTSLIDFDKSFVNKIVK